MAAERWYWCLAHDRAERGSTCRAARRLGPYPTMEEALRWQERVEAREDRWEAQDHAWKGDRDDW